MLDADVILVNNLDGMYKVFVELERNKDVQQIMEIADGIQN